MIKQKSTFSWVWFWFWIFVFFPIAFIYGGIKSIELQSKALKGGR